MKNLILFLKNRDIHTPRIALARFLIGFAMLLTILTNDINVIANHNYEGLKEYVIRHTPRHHRQFESGNLFMMMKPEHARLIVIAVLLLVMTGLIPQVSSVLHVWVGFSIHNFYIFLNGGDHLMFALSIFLLPICLTDRRLNQWKFEKVAPNSGNIVSNMALFFIQVQAAWMYIDASISKIPKKGWYTGTAVYYYTSHYRLGAPDWIKQINESFTLTPMVKIVTWGVLILEIILAACLFMPPAFKRKIWIPAIFFHFLIVLNFGLITFFIAINALLILFLDDEDYSVRFLGKHS